MVITTWEEFCLCPSILAASSAMRFPFEFRRIDLPAFLSAQRLRGRSLLSDRGEDTTGPARTVDAATAERYRIAMTNRTWIVFTAGVAVGFAAAIAIRPGSGGDVRLSAPETEPVSSAMLESRVESWLESLRAALQAKDVETVARLVQLPQGKDEELGRALRGQKDLVVTFSDLTIEPTGPDAAVAKYLRTDSFVAPNGRPVALRQQLTQAFQVRNGALVAERPRAF
jgi:hypothetical protein